MYVYSGKKKHGKFLKFHGFLNEFVRKCDLILKSRASYNIMCLKIITNTKMQKLSLASRLSFILKSSE